MRYGCTLQTDTHSIDAYVRATVTLLTKEQAGRITSRESCAEAEERHPPPGWTTTGRRVVRSRRSTAYWCGVLFSRRGTSHADRGGRGAS